MSTDSFAFLETRRGSDAPWNGESLRTVQRNYRIYDAIAGGRSGGGGGYLIYPRGLPADASKDVLYATCSLITDTKVTALSANGTAQRPYYLHSSKVNSDFTIITHSSGDRFAYVVQPFGGGVFHGHTWATIAELEACCAVPGATDKPLDKWIDLIARMREIESDGASVRLVIWFM